MAGTLILDSDLMVLQREGFFDIRDEFYVDKFPDQFDNIRIDTEIYHFTGEDLRYSVVEYALDSGKFVKTTGDKMTGNLEIHFPADGEIEDSPNLVLQGYRAGSLPYAEITFKNRARNPMTTQVIGAIAPTDPSVRETHFKINSTAITKAGQIMMSGDKLNICALSNGASLNYITAASWDPTSNSIASDIPTNSRRLTWDSRGGSLYNSSKQVVRWDDDAFYVLGNTADGDPVFRVRDDYARYTGVIKNGNDIVTKEYADGQDSKSIPLKGTRATEADLGYTLEQDAVDGPIDFTSDASLNALANNKLVFARNNSVKLSIGSDSDDNVNLYNCNLDVHDNKIINVKYPDSDANSHAVPKDYIDDRVGELSDIVANIADIQSPPGMINAFVGDVAPTGWILCVAGSAGQYLPAACREMHKAITGHYPTDAELRAGYYNVPNLSGRVLAQIGKPYGENGNSAPFGNRLGVHINEQTRKPNASKYNGSGNPGDHVINQMHTEYEGKHYHYMKFWDHNHGVGNIKASTKMQHQASNKNGGGAGELTDPVNGRNEEGEVSLTMTGTTANATAEATSSNDFYNSNSNTAWHSGGLKFTQDYSGEHRHYISEDQWDKYTTPFSYTINWIIKHDNTTLNPKVLP
jgi:hypothetical protein